MLKRYIFLVKEFPRWSAFIQFAFLGTLGELMVLTYRLQNWFPWHHQTLFLKILAWGILGVFIKYGFVGMKGFVIAWVKQKFLSEKYLTGWRWALMVSLVTNIFFGPVMMFIHRLEDNLIVGEWNMTGLEYALLSLLWFWIPVHIITFLQKEEYQIGLAAIWSIVLGIILGIYM